MKLWPGNRSRVWRRASGGFALCIWRLAIAATSDLPDASLDVVTSRAVLEHVPPDVIQDIFNESFRLLNANGLACHIIDNSDHWQHGDLRLSRVNFLRFSDFTFRLTCMQFAELSKPPAPFRIPPDVPEVRIHPAAR